MIGPEVEPWVVLSDLIADLITPLLAMLLPLLAILDPFGAMADQVTWQLARPLADARPFTNTGSLSRTGSFADSRSLAGPTAGRQLAGSGAVLQKLGRGASRSARGDPGARSSDATGRWFQIQKVLQLTLRRTAAHRRTNSGRRPSTDGRSCPWRRAGTRGRSSSGCWPRDARPADRRSWCGRPRDRGTAHGRRSGSRRPGDSASAASPAATESAAGRFRSRPEADKAKTHQANARCFQVVHCVTSDLSKLNVQYLDKWDACPTQMGVIPHGTRGAPAITLVLRVAGLLDMAITA